MTNATTGCPTGTDGDDGDRPGAGPESTAAATKGAMTNPVTSPGAGTNTVAGTATATEIKARDLNGTGAGTGAGKGPGQGGGPRPKTEATYLEPDSAVDAGAGDPFDRDDLPTPRGATRTLLVSLLGPLRGRVVVAALFLLIQQAAVK